MYYYPGEKYPLARHVLLPGGKISPARHVPLPGRKCPLRVMYSYPGKNTPYVPCTTTREKCATTPGKMPPACHVLLPGGKYKQFFPPTWPSVRWISSCNVNFVWLLTILNTKLSSNCCSASCFLCCASSLLWNKYVYECSAKACVTKTTLSSFKQSTSFSGRQHANRLTCYYVISEWLSGDA